MGFFSWTSCVTGKSIMNNYGGDDYDGIVAILPNNTAIVGDYDGYGRITDKDGNTYDIHVLFAVGGDLEKYKEIGDEDSKEFDDFRNKAIDRQFNWKRDPSIEPLHFKLMTIDDFRNEDMHTEWDNYPYISESAEGQGHWLDDTHEPDFVWQPIEDPTLKTEES